MLRRCLLVCALLCMALTRPALAQGASLSVPTRDGVSTTLFWQAAPDARATVLLFPGGGGGFGRVLDGRPSSGNFLVRSVPHFLALGYNVAIFGRPTDMEELGWAERTDPRHRVDMARVLEAVKQRSAAPVWLVGTSRGTVSATAMAIHVRDPAIAGLVLTSSVVRRTTPGAVPGQDLPAIRLPVLVYHHARDACPLCQPGDTPAILEGLTQAPIKKRVLVDGGTNPSGDACGAQHWHGFVGMEAEAVRQIGEWMRNPVP